MSIIREAKDDEYYKRVAGTPTSLCLDANTLKALDTLTQQLHTGARVRTVARLVEEETERRAQKERERAAQ